MSEHLQSAAGAVQEKFDAQAEIFRDQTSLIVAPEKIVSVLTTLRDEFGFNMLMDATAVDYYPQETPRFHVVYQLYSMPHNLRIQVRTPLNGHAPELDTVEKVYPSANWKEREMWDLFGIRFRNHSDLRRIVLPADWTGHPLRKDHPLGYEEVQFTFNYDEVMVNKPHPKD